MDLELYPTNGTPIIEGYGDGYVTVSGEKIFNTFILFPDKLKIIKQNHLNSIIQNYKEYKLNLDLIIYGSNGKSVNNQEVINKFKLISVPIECMKTFSACRTWSVLIGEGRSVSAIIEPNESKI